MPSHASVAKSSESPFHEPAPAIPPPDSEYGPTIFGIVAGGISGTIVGFFIAGSFFASMAAATGVVVGLLMGWHGARLMPPQ